MNPTKISLIKCLVISVAPLVLVGCAIAPKQFAPFVDQTKVVADPSRGRIYVIRPGSMADEIPMKVYDNGKLIGQTGSRSYLCWEREPGQTVITGEVVPVYSGAPTLSKVELTVQAGSVYYVVQHMRIGSIFRYVLPNDPLNELEIVDASKGRDAMRKCKPAK